MLDPISIERLDDGTCWRVVFSGPPGTRGNVLDQTLMTSLGQVFRDAAREPRLKAICLEGAGPDFSFGASVPEHLPDEVAGMLTRFDDMLHALLDSAVVVVAAVRGQCLGGGLELVMLCHRVFASADAKLGQPEIKLGVFAPIASVVLPGRIGRGHAEDLCLTGRTVGAAEAKDMGLVDEVAPGDPADAALAWVRAHLAAHSASSLRFAVRAARQGLRATLARDLPAVEEMYLGELIRTADATEGIRAFLGKRTPVWKDA